VLGAGPVGLGAALELARFGVPTVLVEKHDGTSWHPKTRNFNTRTMEIAKGWGPATYKRLRSIDAPVGWKSPIRFLRSATGEQFGLIESKGFEGPGRAVSPAVPIMSSWAVIAAALSLLLFGERLDAAQLVGGAAVVAGAAVVSRYAQTATARTADSRTPRWLLASLGAAVGFGVVIPAIARLVPVFGDIGSVGVVYLADIALGLPVALLLRIDLRFPRAAAWPALLAAGLFESAGFACVAAGSRLAPIALVSPLASLASAFTVLYAWTVLRERPARAVLAGAALVCAGVVALAL